MRSEQRIEEACAVIDQVRREVGRAIVGYRRPIDEILTGLLCGGHLLIEGVPGIGKTLIIRTLARTLGLGSDRIQFTPDLMPADLLGTEVLLREGDEETVDGELAIRFREGPVFTNLLLGDEINRGTPKTQSALLQAMQERQVSIGGRTRPLPDPFFVLATQNPIEMEGTYPLPEAQLDRFFFKIALGVPGRREIEEILTLTTGAIPVEPATVLSAPRLLEIMRLVREIPAAKEVISYAAALVIATHRDESIRPFVRYGASPRAAQALILAGKARALLDGRLNVSFDDLRAAAPPAFRHRIILSFEGEAEGIEPDDLIGRLTAVRPEELIGRYE